MEDNKEIVAQGATELEIIKAKQQAEFAMTPVGQTVQQFEVMQRMGKMYASSTIIPDIYRNNLGNCVIALDMAMRMKANPLMVMQNLYIVHGNPSFSSKFLIATINASGKYQPLTYEFRGEEGKPSYSCRCVAYEKSDVDRKRPIEGDWISIEMANLEGWATKPGSKWKTMPAQMLRYRAAAYWQRAYCPEISMGLMTKEEYEDIQDVEYVDVTSKKNRLTDIAAAAAGVEHQAEAEQQPEKIGDSLFD